MFDMPLRVGVSGSGPVARGVEFQVAGTDGMDLIWRCEPDDVESKLKSDHVDVFVEACGDLGEAAETSLIAIENHANIVLTDPRVDVAVGYTLQVEAHQQGIMITSDAGTPHGALAGMIQEAHIMGFDTVQAGQISPQSDPTRLLYEMAALANGFGFLPSEGGMMGPGIHHPSEILTTFAFENQGDTPRVDFVKIPGSKSGLYLIVKARSDLPEEQVSHLRHCQLGEGPFYLLRRDAPLGYFETPKAILGAAAGQPVLTPGYPTCDVYAALGRTQPAGSALEGHHLLPFLAPRKESLVPLAVALQGASLNRDLLSGEAISFENSELVHQSHE